jgi:signal transduction histidine kinase
LSNAIKYSPAGGTITVQGRVAADEAILIRVIDQGIGIPADELTKIFERFYRAENQVTSAVRGAGLGLPVCQGIVEAHGGRIWAESEPGAGSTFCVMLPAGLAE